MRGLVRGLKGAEQRITILGHKRLFGNPMPTRSVKSQTIVMGSVLRMSGTGLG